MNSVNLCKCDLGKSRIMGPKFHVYPIVSQGYMSACSGYAYKIIISVLFYKTGDAGRQTPNSIVVDFPSLSVNSLPTFLFCFKMYTTPLVWQFAKCLRLKFSSFGSFTILFPAYRSSRNIHRREKYPIVSRDNFCCCPDTHWIPIYVSMECSLKRDSWFVVEKVFQ